MRYTNNNNLPLPIYNAICNDTHKGGDYSASMLYKSPRMVQLARRHKDEIVKDASEMVWALLGTALHHVIEQGTGKNELAEEYLSIDVNGKTLSGMSDLVTENEKGYKISDYKTVSVWSIIYMSSMDDWAKQLNTYAYLFKQSGFNITELEIVAVCRDWQKSKAKFDPNYPQSQIVTIPITLWSESEQKEYIHSRVAYFEHFNDIEDDKLPKCSRIELWQDNTKYAVMKEGRKSAIKLHENHSDAINHVAELGKGHYLEDRIPQAKRCSYCDARQFCNQYESLKEQGLIDG